jgi:hypothetical protein
LYNGVTGFYKVTFFYMPFDNAAGDDGIDFLRPLLLPQ